MEKIIKSRDRVQRYGEVFTPPRLVEAMLDLVPEESARPESRFLEPACGTGNFLVAILQRKLATVAREGGGISRALVALASLYGVELLADNVVECRQRLAAALEGWCRENSLAEEYAAYESVIREILATNIIHGDFLRAINLETGEPIAFTEWGPGHCGPTPVGRTPLAPLATD